LTISSFALLPDYDMTRRLVLSAAVFFFLSPAAAEAQPRILIGGGVTSPNGDFKNAASAGYHGRIGVELAIPTLPVALRADADFHNLRRSDPTFDSSQILGGGISLVFTLPGVGMSPYLLGGVGAYRVETGPVGDSQAVNRNGFHVGFGMKFGSLGFGGFVEIRYVQIGGGLGDTKYIPVTVGIRL